MASSMQYRNWPALAKYNFAEEVTPIFGGTSYFVTLEKIIRNALESIYLVVYRFDDDETGNNILNALIDAVNRGVDVFVLVDAFGSKSTSEVFFKKINSSKIHFRLFSRYLTTKDFSLGRRLHQKVVVVDGETGLVGGINIANKYRDTEMSIGWLDFAVLVKGNVCAELQQVCKNKWNRKLIRKQKKVFNEKKIFKNNSLVRVSENDFMMRKNHISRSYKQAFRLAKESITIVGAYFVPGRQFRLLLRKASERGVKIRVLLAQRSDNILALYGQRFFYSWMLRNHIEIFEYTSTILHGKMAIVDEKWFTIGSYNLNYMSFYGTLELNLDVLNASIAKRFSDELNLIIDKECILITKHFHKKRMTLWKKFIWWGSYQLGRLILVTTVFLMKKPKIRKNKFKQFT